MPNKQTLSKSASAVVYWRLGIVSTASVFLIPAMIPAGTAVLTILGIALLYLITLDLITLFSSYRNGKRWKGLTDRLEFTSPAGNELAPIGNDLVDRSFNLVVLPELPSSIFGIVVGQFLLGAIGCLLGVGVSVLLRPGCNWLVAIAFIVGIIVFAVFSNRIHSLVSASKRPKYYRRAKANSVPNDSFYQFHILALQLLGFERVDDVYEDQSKNRIAVANSNSQPTWAELSFVRKKDNWQASCRFNSLMNDGQSITTEIHPPEEPGTEVRLQFLKDALYMHNIEVERYCLANQAKAAVVVEENILEVYRYLAITEKLKLQESLSGAANRVLRDWNWLPSWLRTPIVKFS